MIYRDVHAEDAEERQGTRDGGKGHRFRPLTVPGGHHSKWTLDGTPGPPKQIDPEWSPGSTQASGPQMVSWGHQSKWTLGSVVDAGWCTTPSLSRPPFFSNLEWEVVTLPQRMSERMSGGNSRMLVYRGDPSSLSLENISLNSTELRRSCVNLTTFPQIPILSEFPVRQADQMASSHARTSLAEIFIELECHKVKPS